MDGHRPARDVASAQQKSQVGDNHATSDASTTVIVSPHNATRSCPSRGTSVGSRACRSPPAGRQYATNPQIRSNTTNTSTKTSRN